ncbi:MAG: 16S rRNA (cytosine(1402)-N(4))-methyltransferase RsmH [Ruminococcaceae bacterium]|nr:16S rRNA (cytosine(1402)-N(4))-methyltransferase RsmH [Oscillospiraceae bacterium]
MEFKHVSIMAAECMEALCPERGGIYVDCTAGGGGHSFEIARRLPEGSRLISLDRDDDAIAACTARLRDYAHRCTVVKSNFSGIGAALDMLGIEKIDGVMWDLGVSSYQLDEAERGFSYVADAPLDMRMDRSCGMTAADVVNTYSEEALKKILWEFGEEKFSGKIARSIAAYRETKRIETTGELAEIIASSIPKAKRMKESQHPAKRSFQAIRIEVNGELSEIEPSLTEACRRLKPGGRMAVITFHSLEDRIVKDTFRRMAKGCDCPPEFPVCVCGKTPDVKLLGNDTPTAEEIESNPRARSARLRTAEKL